MRILNKIIAFVVMSVLGTFVIGVPIMTIVLANAGRGASSTPDPLSMFSGPLIAIVLTALIVFFAPTGRSAWARSFFLNGLACWALPFAGIVFSAMIGSTMTAGAPSATAAASATAGAAIAGAVMTTALGFVGFFAGIIFLAIAYGLKTRAPA